MTETPLAERVLSLHERGIMVDHIVDLRHRLHRVAELSGNEEETAGVLHDELSVLSPDEIVVSLGGHGIAAVFRGAGPGPTLLIRSDMDALPLPDDPGLPYEAKRPGVAHLCGHDGHMATVVGVAERLSAQRPSRGCVVLLFQPAEETGAGARRVLEDPAFAPLLPDIAIAQHNLPGYPLGSVILRKGIFASASRGLIVDLRGKSAHAAEPHLGRSPLPTATTLAQRLSMLPQERTALHDAAQVTVVGVEVGGPAFGTSPGAGRVMATLRTHREDVMERLVTGAEDLASSLAKLDGLECTITWTEEFPSTRSDEILVEHIARAAKELEMPVIWTEQPFAWSEDFGHFTSRTNGALFGLGSGTNQPALHNGGYDFPDELLVPGRELISKLVYDLVEVDLWGGAA